MRTFSTLFCCVGLAGLFLTFIGSVPQRLGTHEKTPQEIVREAVGTKPIKDTGDPSDQAFSRMIRGFMNDMIAARKKHDRDAAALQPVLDTLYTSKSFETRQHMKDVIAAVRKILQVDGKMADIVQRLPQEAKAHVDASTLSQREKEEYLRGAQGRSTVYSLRTEN